MRMQTSHIAAIKFKQIWDYADNKKVYAKCIQLYVTE